ncbi:hypothetical protein ACTXT7_007191 [Hymenolepis weldensis]
MKLPRSCLNCLVKSLLNFGSALNVIHSPKKQEEDLMTSAGHKEERHPEVSYVKQMENGDIPLKPKVNAEWCSRRPVRTLRTKKYGKVKFNEKGVGTTSGRLQIENL